MQTQRYWVLWWERGNVPHTFLRWYFAAVLLLRELMKAVLCEYWWNDWERPEKCELEFFESWTKMKKLSEEVARKEMGKIKMGMYAEEVKKGKGFEYYTAVMLIRRLLLSPPPATFFLLAACYMSFQMKWWRRSTTVAAKNTIECCLIVSFFHVHRNQ